MIYFNKPIIDFFIKREKKFLSYFDNHIAYCANTGKLLDLLIPGSKCILSSKDGGKLNYVWESIFINTWIGVNTAYSEKLIAHILPQLFPNELFLRQVNFKNYRADFASENTIIEVKQVHWKFNDDTAIYPDCEAKRGIKQLYILSELTSKYNCYLIYVVQRSDVEYFSVADFIDPEYAEAEKFAMNNGVKRIIFNCNINEEYISINKQIEYKPKY